MSWLRRLLLELWAMCAMAGVVGFLGPFGTYLDGDLPTRVVDWWKLLMGAYLIVRPTILLLQRVAVATRLPQGPLVFWGVILSSAPLAMLWRSIGQDEFRGLNGYPGLIPFSLLCALAVVAVVWWARNTADRLRERNAGDHGPAEGANDTLGESDQSADDADENRYVDCPLRRRLAATFVGPIVALQSEDHYVRVHGSQGSELVLVRLRDAIAEMGNVPGEQVHRSWWIAQAGIDSIDQSGRSCIIRLRNGVLAPVARDTAHRLRGSGFLPRA